MADITLFFFLTLQFLFSLQFATLWGINEEKKTNKKQNQTFLHIGTCATSQHISLSRARHIDVESLFRAIQKHKIKN